MTAPTGPGSTPPTTPAPDTGFGSMADRLAAQSTDAEDLAAYRHLHGAHAARDLAADLGISRRQAQRYLAGSVKQPPPERAEAIRAAVPDAAKAAARVRGAQMITITGRVDVTAKSTGTADGTRRMGTQMITHEMRDLLDAAADLLESGDRAGAEALISDAMLSTYGDGKGMDGGLQEYLSIGNYGGIGFD